MLAIDPGQRRVGWSGARVRPRPGARDRRSSVGRHRSSGHSSAADGRGPRSAFDRFHPRGATPRSIAVGGGAGSRRRGRAWVDVIRIPADRAAPTADAASRRSWSSSGGPPFHAVATRLVSYRPSRNWGWSTSHRWKPTVVGRPPTTVSSSARRSRATAVSRSARVDHQLGEEGVVGRGQVHVGLDPGVDPNAGTGWQVPRPDSSARPARIRPTGPRRRSGPGWRARGALRRGPPTGATPPPPPAAARQRGRSR